MITNDIVKTMRDRIQAGEGMNADERRIMHEVMQQIVLAGLYRGGFFEVASFYGGTCLRMFYGLKRFSEDMDFSLDRQNENFNIEPYFHNIILEFAGMGIEVSIKKKKKNRNTTIESAFLKNDTDIYDINANNDSQISIKLEVDTMPPPEFKTESKLVTLPFSFYAKCYTLPDLYAGKMHALIYRGWQNRVKGRDWYDFEWYVRNNVELNLKHFASRASQFNGSFNDGISEGEFIKLLKDKILSTDIRQAKTDVEKFVYDAKELDIWSTEYFLDLLPMIKFRK